MPTDAGMVLGRVRKDGQMARITWIMGPTARKLVMECQNSAVIRRTMTGNLAKWYPNELRARMGKGRWVSAPM